VIQADRTLRTVTVIALAILSLLGGVAVAFTKSFTDRVRMLATESPEQAATMAADTFKAITAVMGVIPLAVGLYLTYVSVRAWRTGEFPPPGTRVLRDTVVTVGLKSRTWATIGLIVAVLLGAGGILIPVWGWRLADSLVQASTVTPVH
jgi:hypothetical protein